MDNPDPTNAFNSENLPRNKPKQPLFLGNTSKTELSDVSMFVDTGLQFCTTNQPKTPGPEKSTRMASEALREKESRSPHSDPPLRYPEGIELLCQKNLHRVSTTSKSKSNSSTPSNEQLTHNVYNNSNNSEAQDSQKMQISGHHLIEPIESSYSVWKYKNQHMVANSNAMSPQQYQEDRATREQVGPARPYYEQTFETRNIEKLPYEHGDPRVRVDHWTKNGNNGDAVAGDYFHTRNDPFSSRPEIHFASRPENRFDPYRNDDGQDRVQNMRLNSPLTQERIKTLAQDNIEYQVIPRRTEFCNNINELRKIVEFQNKNIEFLNEQIYNLTLQNKSLSDLNKREQTEQMNIMKKQFDKINENLERMNGNIESIIRKENDVHDVQTARDDVEDRVEKLEKTLIDAINKKLNIEECSPNSRGSRSHQAKNTRLSKQKEDYDCSSSEECSPRSKQSKCKCACDNAKQDRNKELGDVRKENKPPVMKQYEYEADIMSIQKPTPPNQNKSNHEKNTYRESKKCLKKSSKKSELDQVILMNAGTRKETGQPILYYQPERFAQPPQVRLSSGGKTKKGREEQKSHDRVKKSVKSKSSLNAGHIGSRTENTFMSDEHYLTLNARELAVISEHIPSPEASLHADIGEYQSSSGSDQDESDTEKRDVSDDSNDQLPTFINNAVGKVQQLLQGNGNNAEEYRDDQQDDFRTIQVKKATIDQLKNMGFSYVEDSPNSKRVAFNKSMNTKHEQYHNPTDAIRSPLAAMTRNTNLSFASIQYMQKYNLPTHIHTQEIYRTETGLQHPRQLE